MKKRVPASTTTQMIEDLISGVEGKAERSDLVRLAAQLIIEEALEGEVQEQLGREYYERGESSGHRNGYRPGKLDTAEGRIDYAVPQVRGLDGWKSAVRSALSVLAAWGITSQGNKVLLGLLPGTKEDTVSCKES